jgi:glycopeptide antibiotics resistance protein
LAGTEWADMAQNVVVFVPLGVLLPLVAPVRSPGRAVLGGFLVSLTMEALQFVNAVTGHGGHVADVNDLLANTLGALVGYGVFRVGLLVPALARLARAAAWPVASRTRTQLDAVPAGRTDQHTG